MKNRILFLISPVILAALTLIWLFYKDGRWYSYRQEWPWEPLFWAHIVVLLFYFVALIVSIIRHVNADTRTSSGVFYIVSSIVMSFFCFFALIFFLIFTSGM